MRCYKIKQRDKIDYKMIVKCRQVKENEHYENRLEISIKCVLCV